MARPTKLLNVKKYLEFVTEWTSEMLKRDGKHQGGTVLAPIDRDALREMDFFARAILRKHAAKDTRKDVYVEKK